MLCCLGIDILVHMPSFCKFKNIRNSSEKSNEVINYELTSQLIRYIMRSDLGLWEIPDGPGKKAFLYGGVAQLARAAGS